MKQRETFHPGEFLIEELDARGVTQVALAKRLRVSIPYINDVVRGRRGVSARLAIKLERAGFASAELWLHLQLQYDLENARRAARR